MALISIIVPVYKVEVYLIKCIDSILNQTFKDFELILINDGSPDNCGEICNEYALKDTRIKVIHKKNGGLSSARNAGLDVAKGEYVGFLDSDDWIEPDMYETLYYLAIESKKDISNVGIRFIYKDCTKDYSTHNKIILDKDEAMAALLEYKYFGDYIVVNLFKRELINRFRFKENIQYEDVDLFYKIIDKSNGIVTLGDSKYNYLQREGSIVDINRTKFSIDRYYVVNERINFIKKKYPQQYNQKSHQGLINLFFEYMNNLKSESNNKKLDDEFKSMYTVLNSYFYENLKASNLSLKIKLQLILLKLYPSLYKKIFKLKF